MKQIAMVAIVLATVIASSCSPPGSDKASESGKPAKPTPKPVPVGGIEKMGTIVRTQAGSRVVITNWVRAAPQRPDPPGPRQVYESIGVGFCAGPHVDVTGRELVHLFALELPDGEPVAPDSATGKSELRAVGKIAPDKCVLKPIVFQVTGGTKPAFVVFRSQPVTKWKVP